MFLNLSNHPSVRWDEAQQRAAAQWGEIRDMPFPQVPPQMGEAELAEMAATVAEEALRQKPDCILCQGDFTLCFALVHLFLGAGIPCVAACSERVCEEKTLSDGSVERNSLFRFVRFRHYVLEVRENGR